MPSSSPAASASTTQLPVQRSATTWIGWHPHRYREEQAPRGRCVRDYCLGRKGAHSGHCYRRGADDRPRHQGSPREVIVFQRALQGAAARNVRQPLFIFRQLFYPNQPCRIVLSIQITRRMVVFWLTNFKKNGTIEKSSIGDVHSFKPLVSLLISAMVPKPKVWLQSFRGQELTKEEILLCLKTRLCLQGLR